MSTTAIQMSTMAADLQKHHTELQNYLSKWSKKQQQLLDVMTMSPTPPTLEISIWQQGLTDNMEITDASNIMAPASADKYGTLARAEGQTTMEVEKATGDFAEGSHGEMQHLQHHGGIVLTTAGKEKVRMSQTYDSGPSALERCRTELVNQLQVLVNSLKSAQCPTKDFMEAWLTESLDQLTSEVSKLDMLNQDEQCGPPPEQVLSEKSVLLDRHRMGIYEKILQKLDQIVHSDKFESLSAIVILLNAIVMGISADYNMNHMDSESDFLSTMEIVFFSYYGLELFLRVSHYGRRFCFGPDWKWNCFDLLLVLLSASDYYPDAGPSTMNVSFLRLLRLLKMVKLLRMFRLMKMFRHLRLILASIFGSLCAIFWAGMLVIIVCYMASLLFVNLVSNFLMEAFEQNLDIDSAVREDIEKYWGSVLTGMNSLFGATTGGEDWFTIADPLWEVGNGSYTLFLIYMGFFLIVILNTFSSLFVQSVLENQEKDSQAIIEAEMEKKEQYIAQLQDFYDKIDDDGDGAISMSEFVRHADDPKLHAWAAYLGIDLSDAKHFFEVLSHNGSLTVDIDTFVVGCIKLKGNAKSVDVMSIFTMSMQMKKRIDECYLLLHAKNRKDVSTLKKIEELANIMQARNPLPLLFRVCSNQEKILALASLQAEKASIKL